MENIDRLLDEAMLCLQHGRHFYSGDMSGKWSMSGSVAMHLEYQHRLPGNLDIMLRDAQFLSQLQPRANVVSAAIAETCKEGSHELEMTTKTGDIKFWLSPFVTSSPIKTVELRNQLVIMETPIEVVAKKLLYKADRLTAKDVFDIACVLQREPEGLFMEVRLFLSRVDALELRMVELLNSYREELLKEVVLHSIEFEAMMPNGLEMVMLFVQALKEKRDQVEMRRREHSDNACRAEIFAD